MVSHRLMGLLCSAGLVVAIAACQTLNSSFNPTIDHLTIQSGMTLRGEDLEGAVLSSFSEQGRPLTLKLSDVELDPDDLEQETYLYTVLYQDPVHLQWHNLCLPDATGSVQAIPLAGRWDATGAHISDETITFACTNGVLAKCVRWGYKPWKTVNGQSLQDYHQACTRMARADYCGNGIGHTKDGTPIDVYDRIGIQKPVPNSEMVFEAAWNPNGAVLLHHTRWPETLPQLQQECPKKLKTILHQSQSAPVELDIQHPIPNALIFNKSQDMRLGEN